MKERFLAVACMLAITGLPAEAQTVRFVRSIDLNPEPEKSLASVILGSRPKQAVNPGSIACIGDDRYCVTDAINGAVLILDSQGDMKKRITRAGKSDLVSPVSACADEAGRLYVSDSGLAVVFRYSSDYAFERVFLSPPRSRITGIALSGGTFFCVDTQNHRILCFDEQGEMLRSFGKRGAAGGQFNFPTHIAADADYIYVTDAMNFRVQIFDLEGNFIRQMGSQGRGGGNFSKAKGVAVDRERRIFVADAMFDNVQIFDFEGNFLYYFGGPGHMENEFWMPSGICIHSDDTIWVADTYNGRIQIFQVVEDPL